MSSSSRVIDARPDPYQGQDKPASQKAANPATRSCAPGERPSPSSRARTSCADSAAARGAPARSSKPSIASASASSHRCSTAARRALRDPQVQCCPFFLIGAESLRVGAGVGSAKPIASDGPQGRPGRGGRELDDGSPRKTVCSRSHHGLGRRARTGVAATGNRGCRWPVLGFTWCGVLG